MTTCPALSRVSVGVVNVLEVGNVTLDRRIATVSLLYHSGTMIPENCVEFIKAIYKPQWYGLNVRNITDQSAEHSAEFAERLSVQALDFKKHNKISSAGAANIFRSLEHNTSLEQLDPSWNWRLTKSDSEAVG